MAEATSYSDWLKQEFGGLIDGLDLAPQQKQFFKSRWLDQVIWMEAQAGRNRFWYYRLRLASIVLGAIVPALVSFPVSSCTGSGANIVKVITICVSLIVAISAGVEEFFHFGERWRHYRRNVESMKILGWQFFQLIGPFASFTTHQEAYPSFALAVETSLQRDIEAYVTNVAREKQQTGMPGAI